jgi:hypothetical protein
VKRNELANPMQALIDLAARSTTKDTGESARFRARIDSGGWGAVILADTSSSMDEGAGSTTKIEILRRALDQVVPDLASCRLISFDSFARLVPSPSALPTPNGGTALHLALDLAATFRPGRTLVLSDGRPDDEAAALASGERLPGRIDCIFCGPDSDRQGKDFLARLARLGCGNFEHADLARSSSLRLATMARGLLGLPLKL